MKSLNTKKIVALAAGAALLGSALLGAGSLSFGNTELVNSNGNVMAKVVVGENAAAADGVAAANIAAVLGNRAFKQTEVSATPTGLDGLSCEVSSDGSTGSCEVVSKSVTLEILTPAGVVPAGAYQFETLVDDYVDANLENRINSATGDLEDAPWGNGEPALKIGAGQFPSLDSYVITDSKSGDTYQEDQYLYIGHDGSSKKVKFDTSDDVLVSEDMQVAYELDFDNPGIPVCQDSKGGNWAYCKYSTTDADENKQVENHRVKIKFLGEEWIISEMNAPVDSSAPPSGAENDALDSSIKLAKESAYSPKLQIGESLDLGDGYKLTLGDLKPASGSQVSDYAIFSVFNSDGEEVANEMIAAGSTTEIVTSDGHSFRVRVYQAAPGYTLTEKWAEVAVFADELELKDGDNIDDDENNDWEVNLLWRNEDTNNHGSADEYYDHLRKVQLINDDIGDMKEGDSVNILEDPSVWRMTFTGLNLKDDDYVRVDITLEESDEDFYPGVGVDDDLSSVDKYTLTDDTDADAESIIRIKASDKIFRVIDRNSVEVETDEIILSPFGYTDDTPAFVDDYEVVFKYGNKYFEAGLSTSSSYGLSSTAVDMGSQGNVYYELGGKKYSMGLLMGDFNTDDATTFGDAAAGTDLDLDATNSEVSYIVFGEDADNGQYDFVVVRAYETDVDSKIMEFDPDGDTSGDSEDDSVLYRGVQSSPDNAFDSSDFANTNYIETPYLTHRGSKVQDADDESIRLYLAKKVGKAQFLLQSVYSGSSDGVSTSVTLHEGEEATLSDGVKIRVTTIDCETGACSSGSSGSATVSGTEGVSCELNVPASNLGVRQDVPSDLVVLDSQASGYETVIAVGGPAVNTVTAAILSGTDVQLNAPGDVVVQEVGNGKIVVAGYSAEDTLNAAQQFISSLVG